MLNGYKILAENFKGMTYTSGERPFEHEGQMKRKNYGPHYIGL
jgi:hypothetical protein